jgi:hypothetical protein
MGWPLTRSALLASCIGLGGCGTFSGSARVDVGPLQASLRAQLGIELQRVTPPPGQPGIPALRATFAGGDDQERVTLLEFFEPEGLPQALGSGRAPQTITVLSRRNIAVLYTRTGGPDHRALLERALNAAPLVTGLPKA